MKCKERVISRRAEVARGIGGGRPGINESAASLLRIRTPDRRCVNREFSARSRGGPSRDSRRESPEAIHKLSGIMRLRGNFASRRRPAPRVCAISRFCRASPVRYRLRNAPRARRPLSAIARGEELEFRVELSRESERRRCRACTRPAKDLNHWARMGKLAVWKRVMRCFGVGEESFAASTEHAKNNFLGTPPFTVTTKP